jgi:tRNA-dihydrouridine synthase B
MLKRTARMEAIFRTLKEVVRAHDQTITVGAKLRLGLNQAEKERNVVQKLVPAINAHLDYVTVHARHATQRGSEPADWNALKELRKEINIPCVGNGGVFTAEDAQRMMTETSVDGVLIARGAIKNPWIFRGLTGGEERPTPAEIAAAWRQYERDAAAHTTKPKYYQYHKENFGRMGKEGGR